MLQIITNRIIVPGEELVISYGCKYHFFTERKGTDNKLVRAQYNLRGKPNESMKDY